MIEESCAPTGLHLTSVMERWNRKDNSTDRRAKGRLQKSINLHVGCLADLNPFPMLGSDEGCKLLRRIGLRLAGEIGDGRLDFWNHQAFVEYGVELFDDRNRGAGRSDQTVEGVCLAIRNAYLPIVGMSGSKSVRFFVCASRARNLPSLINVLKIPVPSKVAWTARLSTPVPDSHHSGRKHRSIERRFAT